METPRRFFLFARAAESSAYTTGQGHCICIKPRMKVPYTDSPCPPVHSEPPGLELQAFPILNSKQAFFHFVLLSFLPSELQDDFEFCLGARMSRKNPASLPGSQLPPGACPLLFTAQGPKSQVWGEEATEQRSVCSRHSPWPFPRNVQWGVFPLPPALPGRIISSRGFGLQDLSKASTLVLSVEVCQSHKI